MCVTSLLCGPRADLWPFYVNGLNRFPYKSLYFECYATMPMLIFRAWATCGILAISKPCRVEVKLHVKIVITNPLPCPSHITDAKTESGLVDGFPSMNIFSKSRPYTVFTSFLVSRLVSGLLPCSYRRFHSTMLMM